MAKEKTIDEEEKLKREQEKSRNLREEEEERKKKEVDDALIKKKEKDKKQKIRDKRQKAREQKERKRIRSIIDFPFKVVHNASAVLSITYFLIQLFGNNQILLDSLYSSFIVFIICDLGGCLLVFSIFYAVSQRKEKELMEQIRLNEEHVKMEEERRKKEEMELIETQKVMLETNDDGLEAKRYEELKKFRELKESESKIRSLDDRQSKPALDIEDQLSKLPDDFFEGEDASKQPRNNDFSIGNDFPNFDMNLNSNEDMENPFITMPKK